VPRRRHDRLGSAPTRDRRAGLGDTLIVEATCDKYLEHQPVERQCLRFARGGVEIAPQTLGRSVGAHIDLLMPVAELIAERTRAPGYLGTDATGIPVLDPSVTDGVRNGAMWCWTNARWVSFFYTPQGDSQSVRDFLGNDLVRTDQCDGTSVTNCIERAGGKRPGCMSHGRRRFVEAARSGDTLALEALHLLAPLFEIERASTLSGDTAEERLERRLERSKPIIEKLRPWLDEQQASFDAKTDLRKTFPRFTPEVMAANQPILDLLKDFGEKKGATRAQIALAWLAAKKPWIVPIPGTTNLAHSRENVSSINVEFTPEDLREFEAAFARVTVYGGRMDARQMDQIGKD
jgi:hypothetical protein